MNMAAIILPSPRDLLLFTTDSLAGFYIVAPYVSLCSALWVGAAVATLQDLVLPRMRGTAGATYVLGTSLVGLALGPYCAGKVAALTGGLATGIFSLYVVPPFTLVACGSRPAASANSKRPANSAPRLRRPRFRLIRAHAAHRGPPRSSRGIPHRQSNRPKHSQWAADAFQGPAPTFRCDIEAWHRRPSPGS